MGRENLLIIISLYNECHCDNKIIKYMDGIKNHIGVMTTTYINKEIIITTLKLTVFPCWSPFFPFP